MKRSIGLFIGVIYILFAFGAFKSSMAGWAQGSADLGFWWIVIGVLLVIAGLGALFGTWIHAWADHSSDH